ncbi:hypothetical protein [Sporosarcina sp. ITBMC105]
MIESFRWEVVPMEGESYFVMTATDSVATAAKTFEDEYGNNISVYGIRKAAVINEFEEAI